MSLATTSVRIFGVYAMLTGIGLALVPGLVLAPLGIAAPTEVWIRFVGTLALVVGYYYWACAAAGLVAFYRASVSGRFVFGAMSVLLVVVFAAPVQVLLFGAIDILGALWTRHGLRKDAQLQSGGVSQ